jgi:hypothetical protein
MTEYQRLANATPSVIGVTTSKIDLGLYALGAIIGDIKAMSIDAEDKERLSNTLQTIHTHILEEVEELTDHKNKLLRGTHE